MEYIVWRYCQGHPTKYTVPRHAVVSWTTVTPPLLLLRYKDAIDSCCCASIEVQLPFCGMINGAQNLEIILAGASLNNLHSFVCSNLARKTSLTEEVKYFERIACLAGLLFSLPCLLPYASWKSSILIELMQEQ
jgi:hypothetical protein